jgi:hypothetical protein
VPPIDVVKPARAVYPGPLLFLANGD